MSILNLRTYHPYVGHRNVEDVNGRFNTLFHKSWFVQMLKYQSIFIAD